MFYTFSIIFSNLPVNYFLGITSISSSLLFSSYTLGSF